MRDIPYFIWPPFFIPAILAVSDTTVRWWIGMAVPILVAVSFAWLHYRSLRINTVKDAYLKIQESDLMVNGLDALLRAGAAGLKTEGEMRKVCQLIQLRGKPHPNRLPESLPNKQLLAFIKFCRRGNHTLSTLSEASFLIEQFKGRFGKA